MSTGAFGQRKVRVEKPALPPPIFHKPPCPVVEDTKQRTAFFLCRSWSTS